MKYPRDNTKHNFFTGKGRESIMMTMPAAIELNYPKTVSIKDHRKPLLF
jgi:hypothetical protein